MGSIGGSSVSRFARTYLARLAQYARGLEGENRRHDELNEALAFELSAYGVRAASAAGRIRL